MKAELSAQSMGYNATAKGQRTNPEMGTEDQLVALCTSDELTVPLSGRPVGYTRRNHNGIPA